MTDTVTQPISYGSGHDKYDVAAAVAHAISGRPLEFEDATKHILAAKIQDAVERKREDVAHSVFGAPEEPSTEPEVESASEPVEAPEEPAEETPTEE